MQCSSCSNSRKNFFYMNTIVAFIVDQTRLPKQKLDSSRPVGATDWPLIDARAGQVVRSNELTWLLSGKKKAFKREISHLLFFNIILQPISLELFSNKLVQLIQFCNLSNSHCSNNNRLQGNLKQTSTTSSTTTTTITRAVNPLIIMSKLNRGSPIAVRSLWQCRLQINSRPIKQKLQQVLLQYIYIYMFNAPALKSCRRSKSI